MISFGQKIPVTIRPSFWVMNVLLSLLFSGLDPFFLILWMVIILASVLFHEFGHALIALLLGVRPRIELVAMGGLTVYEGKTLSYGRQFWVTIGGPLFGFILSAAAFFLLFVIPSEYQIVQVILVGVFRLNLLWSFLNLIPILPLDGGQVVRICCEKCFGVKGIRYAYLVGVILSVIGGSLLLAIQWYLGGFLLLLFAFENWNGYRKAKFFKAADRDVESQALLKKGEEELFLGHKEKALELFESLKGKSSEGLIHDAAAEYAAFLEYSAGKKGEAYKSLQEVPLEELSPQGLYLLHELGFEEKNWPLVRSLAAQVFQLFPKAEVAMRSAQGFAEEKKVEEAVHWIEAAVLQGLVNGKEVLVDPVFDPIRQDPIFQKLQRKLESS